MLLSDVDASRNKLLLASARTRYKVGQHIVRRNGTVIRIKEVQPKGFVCRSAGRNYLSFGSELPAVVNDQDLYIYEPMSPGASSGQTTEAGLLDG